MGHRFNPNKLVLDPYAKAHIGQLKWGPEVFGYTLGAHGDDLTFDNRDSAPLMPKCVVVDPAFTWSHDRRLITTFTRNQWPNVPWDRTIIYELHVKGFTKRNPKVPENLRGTFAGLARQEIIEYIRSLGVTSVELLPIHSFVDDGVLLDRGLTN
jgi:isoamylase